MWPPTGCGLDGGAVCTSGVDGAVDRTVAFRTVETGIDVAALDVTVAFLAVDCGVE